MKFFDLFNPEKQRRQAENNYLNTATDIVDLEGRMREIDRGKFRSNNSLYR